MALTSGSFLTDAGVPDSGVGVDGDHYRDTDTQILYFRESNIWSAVGNLLDTGPDGIGTIFLKGSGVPTNDLGVDDNYYRDTVTEILYSKDSGLWHAIGTLRPVPAEGTTIISGEGAPEVIWGANGDYYRDGLNQDIYLKTSGAWALIGSWAQVALGSLIHVGAGVPDVGLGVDNEFYIDSLSKDFYQKQAGIWVVIGSISGGTGGAFEIGDWDLSIPGGYSPLIPVGSFFVTTTGVSPNFTLTPNSLVGFSGPSLFIAGCQTQAGILPNTAGTKWTSFEFPAHDVGDNLGILSVSMVSSAVSPQDAELALNGGTPTTPMIGVSWLVDPFTGAGNIWTFNAGLAVMENFPLGASAGDTILCGFDFDTGIATIMVDGGSAYTAAPVVFSNLLEGDTFKLIQAMFFSSSTSAFNAGSWDVHPSFMDLTHNPFEAADNPALPVGAADGKVYLASAPGWFNLEYVKSGDYLQLYSDMESVLVTSTGVRPQLAQHTHRLVALEGAIAAIQGTVDVQAVEDVLPGATAFGVVQAGAVKRLLISGASQEFTLSASTGKTIRTLLQPVLDDYAPAPTAVVTINGIKLLADGVETSTLELYHSSDDSVLQTRFLVLPNPAPAVTILVGDGDAPGLDVPHCSGSVITLDGPGLSGTMASFLLTGPQWTQLIKLHEVVTVRVDAGSPYGITDFAGTGIALAPGEALLRFRNGTYLKV